MLLASKFHHSGQFNCRTMVNKDELVKGYVIKAQNSISKTQTSHYPAFEFMFSVFHMFPPIVKKNTTSSFGLNRKPSTKNSQHLRLILALAGLVQWCSQLVWGTQKLSQLSTLSGAVRTSGSPDSLRSAPKVKA